MRPSKYLAVAVSGCALAAAAMMPAIAGTGHHAAAHHPSAASKTHQFPSTLSPTTAHTGTVMTLKGHGAKKKTTYNCLFIVIKGANYGADTGSLKFVTSTKKGKLNCKLTFKPFKETPINGGPARHCPLTKKDKKAGFKCEVAASTTDMTSATTHFFTAKK